MSDAKAASKSDLKKLHVLTTEALTAAMKGEPISGSCPECGAITKNVVDSRQLAVAIKFLRDNSIEAVESDADVPATKKPALVRSLPFVEDHERRSAGA